jgi:hypothetical protein
LVGGLPFCRYSFSPKQPKSAKVGGAGLYACFYRKKLVYIGKYLGVRNNCRAGDIVSMRWVKHVGTFTTQARNLGFSKKALSDIEESISNGGGAELKIPEEVIDGFQVARRRVLQRKTGCMTTFQRFLVSVDVWQNAKDPGVPDLSDFEFVYSRIEDDMPTERVRELVSSAENHALERAHPPGNTISRRRPTPLPDLSDIAVFFEAALSATFSTETYDLQPVQDTTHSNETPPESVEPEEDMTRFEASIEEAPIFSQKFVENIQAHFADVEDADIEFTNTPDMRVRKLLPHTGLGFRNCMRFEWQPTKKRFLMYSRLSNHDLKSFGLSLDRTRTSDKLPNVTFLYEQLLRESESSLFEAVSKAHSAFEL